MIYVDSAFISADVTDPASGRIYKSRWCHLISDQMDPTELIVFATRQLRLKPEWFQMGKSLMNRRVRDLAIDHFDLTETKRATALHKGAHIITPDDFRDLLHRKRSIMSGEMCLASISGSCAQVTNGFVQCVGECSRC